MATTNFINRQTPIMAEWLNDVDDAVYRKLVEYVSVTDYGAVGNGTGDLGVALQAAHNALGADGGIIHVPAAASYYLQTTTAAFTKPIRLVGDGWYNSEILSNTASLIFITTTSRLDVVDLHFTALTTARGDSTFIKTLAAAANHSYTTLRNCYFDGASRCYWSERTNALHIDGCLFGSVSGYGLYLENLSNPDEGDSFITNSTFAGDTSSINIYVPSTSGINVNNCKFNNAVIGHVLVDAGATAVGNYLFTNNSVEGHDDYGFKFRAVGGTLTKVLITGNQFSSDCNNHIVVASGTQNVTITGNTFNSTSSATGNGIAVETSSHDTTIVGNAFHQILTAITTSASTNLGITLNGNRFANDVTTMFVGDDGVNTYAPQKEISLSRFVSNSSQVTYVDAIKVIGYGTLEVKVYGVIEGVGVCNYYKKVLLSGTTVADIDTAVTSGASFDVQLAASGGYLVVSVKRATGVGTSTSVYVDVTAKGHITDFRKA